MELFAIECELWYIARFQNIYTICRFFVIFEV